LARFAATLPAGCLLVEIGSFAGESTELFLASGRVGLMVCVDLWSETVDTFPASSHMAAAERAFDRRTGGRGVLKVKRASVDAARLFADGFADAIYLDGDHRYGSVLADLAAWRGKVRAGGIIAGHDWWMPEVRRAVFESFARPPDAIYGDGVKGEGTWVYRV
jgi:predicted O-methyltransferase YrrM